MTKLTLMTMAGNQSRVLLSRLLSESLNRRVTFSQAVKGVSFDTETPIRIPAGQYTIFDTDLRDETRYLLVSDATGEIYAVSKEML